MKLVIAATGASGTIYLQRLLEQINYAAHEIHLVMSTYARHVAKQEVDDFKIPAGVSQHSDNEMNVPFVSGSARFDAMVIVPCSMATLGRIASGSSDSALLRGVRAHGGVTAVTHSILMRAKSKTVRFIRARHNLQTKTIRLRSDNREHWI